jgi:hypothetical protein
MIFISHNHNDKLIVEPVAVRLRDVYGEDLVFYDSWSMKPGDGVIDKMSEGLAECEFFFFFVSKNSLRSKMVSLEWQNAVMKATKDQCRLIPVRLDGSSMPAIMLQTLYIDLYTNGLDAAIAQMVDVINGESTFRPAHHAFSNIEARVKVAGAKLVELEVVAKHYLEPIAHFLVVLSNGKGEVAVKLPNEGPFISGFSPDYPFADGTRKNVHLVKANRGITPTMPLRITLTATGPADVTLELVSHRKGCSGRRAL